MTRTGMTWVIVVLTVGALVGCKETVDSSNIRTGGIAALTDVTARSENASTVVTQLRVGGDESNTFVILGSGDRIYAEADGDRKEMTARSEGVYEAEFDTGAADTEFKVSLEREEDDSAPDSIGTLPAPFDISAPTAADTFLRATDDVVITWDPGSTDDVRIEWNGSCVFIDSATVGADKGSYTLPELRTTAGDEEETCDVDVDIRRSRSGSADRAFDGESWFRLHQVRSTSFRSAP